MRGVLGHVFRASLVARLKEVLGREMVEEKLERRPSNIIVLCWYSTMKSPSKGHDEVDRYISLYNLCLSMIPTCSALAAVCAIKGLVVPSIVTAAGVGDFARYWY